ncbi:MAG: cytochrome d ubiquinol oxidase subunit II [Gammaproteobacteria bacterium]
MEHTITLILAGILAFVVVMYVLLDGFDLGVGILFPFLENDHERDLVMSSLTPVWDGNETWLVLGGATLYGAFPIVYSTILPTLYLPLFLMLIALVFRGVSFEFRHVAKGSKWVWTTCFALGSTIAAFCQGVVLGTFVQGYTDANGNIMISDYHSITSFTIMTGLAVIAGYALLGSAWLIKKTEGNLRDYMFKLAKYLLIVVTLFMAVTVVWTPFIVPGVLTRWFTMPTFAFLLPLPILGIATAIVMWFQLTTQANDNRPFVLGMLLFAWAYLSLIVSQWPYAIPRAITVWDAAAPFKSQVFILVGLLIVIPIILTYTIYSYAVFKGKVSHDEGAHY